MTIQMKAYEQHLYVFITLYTVVLSFKFCEARPMSHFSTQRGNYIPLERRPFSVDLRGVVISAEFCHKVG